MSKSRITAGNGLDSIAAAWNSASPRPTEPLEDAIQKPSGGDTAYAALLQALMSDRRRTQPAGVPFEHTAQALATVEEALKEGVLNQAEADALSQHVAACLFGRRIEHILNGIFGKALT